ncbi:MAG: class I SAM-dependent methyltransferase [Vicinamibacterales bacterium]
MSEAIYQRPADYDLEHDGDDRDVRFYRRLVHRLGAARILELACGSGRVTLPLAACLPPDGRIVGVELADEMLADARRKRDDAPPEVRARVHLEQGDMCRWRSDERFDLVLVACSSITHLQTIDDQLALWETAGTQLVPGGRFVIDVTLPDFGAFAESLRTPPRALTEIDLDQTEPETGERLIRQRTTRFDAIDQRADIQFLYDRFHAGRHVERYVSDFTSHVYFPRELQLLYRLAGFTLETMWADYTFEPPAAGTREVVLSGRRPGAAVTGSAG